MNIENKSQSGEGISKNDALVYVQAKKLEIQVTGRIDSEPSDFATIENELKEGLITPKEAVAKVDELIASRQDYN